MWCRRAVIHFGIVFAMVGCFASRVEACNTPVYRYAMDNWAPAPFEVYYFYRQKIAADDEAVHKAINDLSGGGRGAANVKLVKVDVDKASELDRVPAPVKESWKSKHKSGVSTYLVWAPWGAEVFAGRLDPAAVREMADSPARTRLGELLKQGNAAVLLILAGPNEADNRRAEAVAKEVIARGADGKIPVAGAAAETSEEPATQTPGSKTANDEAPARDSSRLELAQFTLSRSDPKERWLLRMLLAVEPDLPQYANEPMIFVVYGRGRAMQPYVGKGITADNLSELAAFLAGACSCQVKDQNPGVDMLFHWDWDATADALAAADPVRSRNQPAYEEFAADAMSEKSPAKTRSDVAAPGATKKRPAKAESDEPAAGKPADPAIKPAKPDSRPPQSSNEAPSETLKAIAAAENAGYDAGRHMWKYGIGLALVTMLLLVTGAVVLRRQSP